MFLKQKMSKSTKDYSNTINTITSLIDTADAIIVGAGSGLSTTAGFTYSGTRFDTYFNDFKAKYGINDMYSGGFFNFPTTEEKWAWWSRVIWLNRYQPVPKATYRQLINFLSNSNYFVLTTNVDHQFQLAGIDKARLFYTQGDYGLFQQNENKKTLDNYQLIKNMILSQGFKIGVNKQLLFPKDHSVAMKVAPELAKQAQSYTLNLRVDDHFVEDTGWYQAAARFNQFMTNHQKGHVLFLELGVGMNTPGIIKYPFWNWTYNNPNAHLITVDKAHAFYPEIISNQSLAIQCDLAKFVDSLSNIEHD